MPMRPSSRTQIQQTQLRAENADLRTRLEEAEEILSAIRRGKVDALVVSGEGGEQIFTLKQAEDALAESEEKFRKLVESLPSVVYMNEMGGENAMIYVSPQISAQLGYTPEEWLADPELWSKSIHPDDYQRVMEEVRDTNRGNEAFDMEYRMLARDGYLVWVHDQSLLVHDLMGKPKFRQGILLDITARKNTEDALQESDEKFRRLVEHLPTVVYLKKFGDSRPATYVSPQIETILGYTPTEWLADPKLWLKSLHPEDRQQVLAQTADTDQSHKPFDMEYRMHTRDGHLVWVHDEAILVNDLKGEPQFWQGIMLDITERKRAETEIHQRLSELEVLYQSGLALGQLVKPKVIAQKMIDLLDQKMDWHHTAVRLYDPQNETLELLVFNQPNLTTREERAAVEQRLKTSVTNSHGGFSGWVVQHGEAVRSNDLQNDLRYFETFPGLQSGLYVPIKIAERVIGVISIESEQAQAFSESDERLAITLATQAAIAIEHAQFFESLKRSNMDLELAYDATIEGWSHALDLRDKETEGHSLRVTEMTVSFARNFGLSEAELVQVRWGALLHDIGKMGVPDGILLKPGPLTEEEWVLMRQHPRFAYNLLSPIRHLRLALDIPYCHHEKWDGTGYPRELKGEQIPLTARIFAVVDVWDALRSDRPYRAAWAEEKVNEHILALSGTQFDPHVVDVFLQVSLKTMKPISGSATLLES